jgi:hypothetical protein
MPVADSAIGKHAKSTHLQIRQLSILGIRSQGFLEWRYGVASLKSGASGKPLPDAIPSTYYRVCELQT